MELSRAIRSALVVSATMPALAGSGVALAACTPVAPAIGGTVTCSGNFPLGLPDGEFTPVADMTLVVTAGSTIIPGVGVIGTDADEPLWTGIVTVDNSGEEIQANPADFGLSGFLFLPGRV